MSNFRLLIIEDNVIAASILASFCENMVSSIIYAPSYTEALALLMEETYDLIFTDLNLGDGYGKTLIQHIRNTMHHPNQYTPIVVVSSSVNERVKIECLQAGANEVLIKPVSKGIIEEILKNEALMERGAIKASPLKMKFKND